MATPIAFNFINSKPISCSFVSLLIISLFLGNFCILEARKVVERHYDYETVDVSSLLSSSPCKASVQGPSKAASLKVVHRHGSCSKLSHHATDEPTLAQVLTQDQSRVASIHNRVQFDSQMDDTNEAKAAIPAKSGVTIGSGNYVVTIGLGTPTKSLTLVFDTGSDLTWTQCEPCVGSCYDQQEAIFNPSASSSYGNISCNSPQCSQLSSSGCDTSNCLYGIFYLDKSFTLGFLGKEKLTLTSSDTFDDFFFGCGENNQGFSGAAGLLGLGTDTLSLVSQTAQKYGKYFSYCLPTRSGSDGHLTFGKTGAPSNLAFTPFASDKKGTFYYVTIEAISVGGQQLPISPLIFQQGGNVIDSGTVITRLAPTAYVALRDAFKQQMAQYPLAQAFHYLDTCYDFSNQTNVHVPIISFSFAGNVKVDLGSVAVLVAPSPSQVCLAFEANKADTDVGIFGNIQQQTFEISYDVAGGRLGFAPAGCS